MCPSEECESDPRNCHGIPEIGKRVESFSFTVRPSFRDRTVRINARHSDGSFAALFEFPPNVLQSGWNVSITAPNSKALEIDNEHDSNDCGRDKEKKEFVSSVVQFNIIDEDGRSIRKFDSPLTISTFAYPLEESDSSRSCYGFNRDGEGDDWECNYRGFNISSTKTYPVSVVTTKSDHLTSFAVLLGSNPNDSCGLDWISIASIAMIGSTLCWVVVCALVYRRSVRVQAFVGGYKVKQRMAVIQMRLQKAQSQEFLKNPLY